MDGSWTSVQQLPALQYAAAGASPRSNIPDASRDANGAMSAEAEEGASGGAACPASCSAEAAADSSLGCGAKVNTGIGGGGGGAKRDASAAAWSANIGAGGATSTVEKGFAWWLVREAMLFDDGVVGVGAGAVVVAAVGLPLLERGEDAEARRGFLVSAADVGVDGAEEADVDDDDDERLALRQPPPTGTFRRTPPLVQYRRQLLQKWRGCDRL
jgi:hypothetical protein